MAHFASRTCEMRNRNCCYLTCCHSWESELFNRDHSNDPSPCNASQQDTLLLVTAHPSLRQLLSISTSSALQTPGPQSYLPTPHNRSCSKIRDFVCRFVAQLQYTVRGHFRLEVNRIAVRPPGLHIPYASAPLPHNTSLLSYEAHDCAISILQRHIPSFSLHIATWT
jgi:hypothetical protein